MTAARDRRTIRRGLTAGGVAAGVVGVPLTVAALLGDGSLVAAAVMAGLTAGVLLCAGWLLLALGLDLLAGDMPGAGRGVVTVLFAVLALLMPFLLLAAVTPG